MRRIFILLAFMFIITSTASAATISGIVVDVNDNPIAGMPVESYTADNPCCSGPSTTTTVDSTGHFTIDSGKIILFRPANSQYYAALTPIGTAFPAGYYKITYSVMEGGSSMISDTPPEKVGRISKFKDDHPQITAGSMASVAVALVLGVIAVVGLIVGSIPIAAVSVVAGIITVLSLTVGALTAVFVGVGDPGTQSYQAIQFFTEAVVDAADDGIVPDTEQFKEWFIDFMEILIGDKAAKTVGWIHFSTIFILTFIAAQFIQKEADI